MILKILKKLITPQAVPPLGASLFYLSEKEFALQTLCEIWAQKQKVLYIRLSAGYDQFHPHFPWFKEKDFGMNLLKQENSNTSLVKWHYTLNTLSPNLSENEIKESFDLFLFHSHLAKTQYPIFVIEISSELQEWSNHFNKHFTHIDLTQIDIKEPQKVQEQVWMNQIQKNGELKKDHQRFWIKIALIIILSLCILLSPKYLNRDLSRNHNLTSHPENSAHWIAQDEYQFKKMFKTSLYLNKYLFLNDLEFDLAVKEQFKLNTPHWNQKEGLKYPVQIPQILSFKKLNQVNQRDFIAYKWWGKHLSDSLIYPTDYWWRNNPEQHRLHDGIDIGAKEGTRILSPIKGILKLGDDDRAGRFIAVQDSEKVVLFAHCDQILFFEGDSVRKGEDLATVGMTGNTTGPHVHIGTGIRDPQGDRFIGGLRYKMIDPVEWYYRFQNKLK